MMEADSVVLRRFGVKWRALSARSSQFDSDQTYWLTEARNLLPDSRIHEIVIIGPHGSAKA